MSPHPSGRLLPANLPTTNLAGSVGLARSFELVKAEILRVPADVLVPADVDVPGTARVVLGVTKRLATLLPELAQLDGYDVRPVRRLRLYASAVLYLHILVLSGRPDQVRLHAMRDGAFVLFLQAYQHCRRGVMLLRWPEGDAGAFLPPLQKRRSWWHAGVVRSRRALMPEPRAEEVTMR